jgi:two-component system sensor histidine kinase KdpD
MNFKVSPRWQQWRYPLAAALCIATMLVALPLRKQLDVANIDMLFLLAVFVIAVRFGRGPAVLAAFLSVALFDFFFVPPYLSFAVADAQYLITFAVMLAVGLITSHLVARLAERTAAAQAGERDTRQLYELARELGTALSIEQVDEIIGRFHTHLDLTATLLIADSAHAQGPLRPCGSRHLAPLELNFALSVYERNVIVETDSLAGTGVAILFLPLSSSASNRVLGVLASGPRTDDLDKVRSHRPLLEAAASLVAITLERLHYADVAQRSEVQIAAERLRTSILASLSHDLRTPLTSLIGLADTLAQDRSPADAATAGTADIIRDQARAMHHMLSNMLEMARLQAGNVALKLEWQPFEEVVGSGTRLLANLLAGRPISIRLPGDLPLVRFDAVLIERVVCNLLENAAKYSPAGSPIGIAACVKEGMLEVSVDNDGPGFPPDRIEEIFDPFVRGHAETPIAGTGLGLTICKAIVHAHGGTIEAANRPGGACVRFALPLGTPPALAEEAQQ